MKLPLIQKQDEQFAQEKLSTYYEGDLLPAEKKLYLTDLRSSHGPYMGIESSEGKPHYLMDSASQIATLGLGFNSSVFLGPAHYLESWTNENHTEQALALREGFESFLKRKLNWQSLHTTFCNSGAEANEIALGYCYRSRKYKKAHKVLAFEGSFHGRMLVSLQATWNPSKREPFLFPGFEAAFCPFPELKDDQVILEIPKEWRGIWDNSTLKDFKTPNEWESDPQLKEEVRCLKEVREKFLRRDIFSIIVEPMQCEGGDRYGSNRFYTALLLMAKSFGIGLIFDEVQTGFHLGREFFWHKMLDLKDESGSLLSPDYVVCAKKAQIGLVIGQDNDVVLNSHPEEYSMVSMIRGYFHGLALDQSQALIIGLENNCRERLDKLISKYSEYITRPRLQGLSFAFDIVDLEKVNPFIAARFEHGLLYYPAGDRTLRFRLNTSYSNKDLDFLFERLEQLVIQVLKEETPEFAKEVETEFRTPENTYRWHEMMVTQRLLSLQGNAPKKEEVFKNCKDILTSKEALEGADLIRLTNKNFDQFKLNIEAVQKEVYEPARQTALSTFEKASNDPNGICLLLVKDGQIEAMAISATTSNFPLERVLRRDPEFERPDNLYMVDCTVRAGHQGKGLGRQMKAALNLVAMSENKHKIVGRNRDRLAGAMLSINLSLGAREKFYVPEDYADFETYRDVFYYNNDLQWEDTTYRLDNAITAPLSSNNLDTDYLKEQLPFLNNKVCLSNFVSLRYLDHFKLLFNQLPAELRHGYSASGQSECVDKIAKSMFVADTKRHKMVSFHGHYFGLGSFMSRSLSSAEDGYFPVSHYDSPNETNWKEILEQLKKDVDPSEVLGVWIEPLPQSTLSPVPRAFLIGLRNWTKENKINLVYNDTASSLYRYDNKFFSASTIEEIKPDAGYIFMGGQAAMVFANSANYMAKPLMMISTWDGDEFSYATFTKYLEAINSNLKGYHQTVENFSARLQEIFESNSILDYKIHNGVGTVTGDIPQKLSKLMSPLGNGVYKFIPSYGSMVKFLKGHK